MVIVLTDVSALSGWSLAAYGALLARVAVSLLILCRAGERLPQVVCRDGVCVEFEIK